MFKARMSEYITRRFLCPEGGVVLRSHQLIVPVRLATKVGAGGNFKTLKAGETYKLIPAGTVTPGPGQTVFQLVAWCEVNPVLTAHGFTSWSFREIIPGDPAPDFSVFFTATEDFSLSSLDWLVRVTTEGGTYTGWQKLEKEHANE